MAEVKGVPKNEVGRVVQGVITIDGAKKVVVEAEDDEAKTFKVTSS